MRGILTQSNLDLLREIARLESALSSVSVLPELSAYHERISKVCEALRKQGHQNLRDLNLDRDEILPDILSETQKLANLFRLYNEHFASPILRSLPSDRLCLRVITWLHGNHPETQNVPVALSDGGFSIWPEPQLPIVYFMPPSRQHGLLYLPLFFHEFGHLLYACHRPEMNNLVYELQKEIADLLEPISQRDDLYAQEEARRRTAIAETWYEWAQELFCDMVGFIIGGPCFVNAFSMYLRMGSRDEFHLPREKLEFSRHPVTWLRIQLLADQARQIGWSTEADELEDEWDKIAATMEVTEDYYGFYDPSFLPSIRKALNDMLEEASPYQFTDRDVFSSAWEPDSSTPVHLLNRAWSIFLNDPSSYDCWEEQTISTFLASTETIDHEREQTH
jgi:hypothetical protein